jgi:hypothetical protein
MADKLAGGVKAGSTSYTTDIVLRSSVDGTEITGKVAADMTASYWRPGGTRTAITLSDLAAVNSAFSSGGVKEVDGTNMRGTYRLDVPDAALATGVDWVELNVFVTGSYVYKERIALETKGAAEVFTVANAIKAVTDVLVAPATIATAVWAAATRTITAFGFNVSLSSSVWDESSAGHNTAGTMGQKLNAAGGATDPLTNTVPGAYAAGTAGFVLGNLSSDAASIAAIKTKTDQLTFTTPNVVDASGGASATAIAAAVLNTAMTEGYAADGSPATLAQMQYMLWAAAAAEKVISGTTMTVKKLDGTSTAMTFTLNDPTNPTSITRSS